MTALGGLVVASSLQVGGYDFDEAIVRSLEREQRLSVGQEQAEALKIEIGRATDPCIGEASAAIAGRDMTTGLLRRVSVGEAQVAHALRRPLGEIVQAVKDVLDRTPAELSADIAGNGLTLVGGGSLLRCFDTLLEEETGLTVTRDVEPLTTVARGAGAALEQQHSAGRRRN